MLIDRVLIASRKGTNNELFTVTVFGLNSLSTDIFVVENGVVRGQRKDSQGVRYELRFPIYRCST